MASRAGLTPLRQTLAMPATRCRRLSTSTRERKLIPRRAMLYGPSTHSSLASCISPRSGRPADVVVPGSNARMLEKSFASPADSISYDLEDSVSPGKKAEARRMVAELLDGERRAKGEVMARVNAVGTGFEIDDVDTVLRTRNIEAIALPKTNHPDHLAWLISRIQQLCPPEKQANGANPIRIIGMIESAEAMVGIREIARAGKGHLEALLFAAEDYCADVGITRTAERTELLYPRSQLVTTAKAFGLQAIDLVCVDYKDEEALRRECEEGRRLGFDGKQAIHPAQIDIIHAAYSPSEAAIRHAARVKVSFELNDRLGKGSYSLDGKMIDAPVYKQALKVLYKAEAAGLAIPQISEDDVKP